jgi:chromosomal replication initiator protein
MCPLEITPLDLRPIDRGVRARLMGSTTKYIGDQELKAILAELHMIKHSINALIPRVRMALVTAIDERADVKMSDILSITANHFRLRKNEILSMRRTHDVLRPRQIAMYLCHSLTTRSYSEIAMFFCDRDHTTIMHAVSLIIRMMADDAKFFETVTLLSDAAVKAGAESVSPSQSGVCP